MKKLILFAVLSVIGAQAQATPNGVRVAHLNTMYFETGSTLAAKEIHYGHVSIDRFSRTIELKLQPAFHCPAGAVCAMVMPQMITIELPNLQVKKGGCGEVIYTAEKNLMPVDGPRRTLEVVDNRHNYCEIYPIIPTVVRYTVETPRPYRQEEHQMHGDEFLN